MNRTSLVDFGFQKLPATVVWEVVGGLYADDARLLYGSILLILAAALAFARTGSVWFMAWGAASVPVAWWRLAAGRAYRLNRDRAIPEEWVLRSLAGAWATGALWGAVSLVLVVQRDSFVQFSLIICQTAFVAGGAVRNSSVPVIAKGQTLLASLPLVVASLATGDAFYQMFALFAAFYIVTTWTIIESVHRQTMKLLAATDEKSLLVDELTQVNRQLEDMASTDSLTRVQNRRGLDVRLSQEWRRSARSQAPLSILMLDVDHFKLFNDHYGHPCGDDCLYRVAQGILEASRRPADIVARYGGEEFAVVLPETDECGAMHVAERVRCAIVDLAIRHAAYPLGIVTVSVGCATAWPQVGTEPSPLVELADEALFQAKREGRNRVSSKSSEAEPDPSTHSLAWWVGI